MYLCYVDEAGDTGVLPSASAPIQPVLVVGAVAIPESSLKSVTNDFLALKRRRFPGARPAPVHPLDWTLYEVKGAELRRDVALGGRDV